MRSAVGDSFRHRRGASPGHVPGAPRRGREDDLEQLAACLPDPANRLVTVVGPGGIGKTRLSLQAAVEQLDNFTENNAYSELEKTVIAFSEQFTRKAQVDDGIMVGLKQELGDEHLVKFAAAVGQANWTNRFNNAFGVELP